jgi:hypothetical protein
MQNSSSKPTADLSTEMQLIGLIQQYGEPIRFSGPDKYARQFFREMPVSNFEDLKRILEGLGINYLPTHNQYNQPWYKWDKEKGGRSYLLWVNEEAISLIEDFVSTAAYRTVLCAEGSTFLRRIPQPAREH